MTLQLSPYTKSHKKIRPIGNLCVIQLYRTDISPEGIHIPEAAQKQTTSQIIFARVIEMGPGGQRTKSAGRLEREFEPGDIIMIPGDAPVFPYDLNRPPFNQTDTNDDIVLLDAAFVLGVVQE